MNNNVGRTKGRDHLFTQRIQPGLIHQVSGHIGALSGTRCRPFRQHVLTARHTNHCSPGRRKRIGALPAKPATCAGNAGDAPSNIEFLQPCRHQLVVPLAASLPCLAGDGGHETFLDHNRVLVDDWHLDIAGFAL